MRQKALSVTFASQATERRKGSNGAWGRIAIGAGVESTTMSAFSAWIRSATGPTTTHFWGPVANWGFVVAVGPHSHAQAAPARVPGCERAAREAASRAGPPSQSPPRIGFQRSLTTQFFMPCTPCCLQSLGLRRMSCAGRGTRQRPILTEGGG